jgi:hypothetical protein
LSGWGRGVAPNIPAEEQQPPSVTEPVETVPQVLVRSGGGRTFNNLDFPTDSPDLPQVI